jgi:hypothetical protein
MRVLVYPYTRGRLGICVAGCEYQARYVLAYLAYR